MANLFILRHAHSANNALNDFDRTITEEGINKCSQVGAIINNYDIDIIFSSDALRTKETVENITKHSKKIPQIKYLHSLYNATAKELLEFIEQEEQVYDNILLVGHNPSISQLALLIDKEMIEEDIQRGFSPASLAMYRDKKLISFWR